MSAGWVAGDVRAKALLDRRLGAGRTREIAAMESLTEAQHALVGSAYARGVVVGQPLGDTEHAVAAALLWHLRVLAGWQPHEGAQAMRSLAGAFEAANVIAHARMLAGAQQEPLFDLGALAIAWPRLRDAPSLANLRAVMSRSAWGDPGGDSPSDIAIAAWVAWSVGVASTVPEASRWAAGGLALLVARRHVLQRHRLPDRVSVHAARVLGPAALASDDLTSFIAALPRPARWALAVVSDIGELWRGEAAWWSRLEADGMQMLGGIGFSRTPVIGAAAALAADAWRCRAALRLAARGGGPIDVFDAIT
jgi:hypothetical protein